MPMVNCEVSLTLTWSENCVITSMGKRAITNTQRGGSPTGASFEITDTTMYVPVVTLSTEANNKLLLKLEMGF